MQIIELYIDGFDNIINTKITLSDLTALLSVNNYGKSNLLSAIKAGLTLPGLGKLAQRRFINSTEHASINKKTYRNLKGLVKPFSFEVIFKGLLLNKAVTVKYGYSIKWKEGIETEFLRISDNGSGGKQYLKRDNEITNYLSTEHSRCDRRLTTDPYTLAITTLSYFESRYNFHELPEMICGITFPVFDTLDTENVFESINMFYDTSDSSDLFSLSRTNTCKALFNLREISTPTFQLIENTFITLFPQYTNIVVEKISSNSNIYDSEDEEHILVSYIDDEYRVAFIDKYLIKPASAENLSNGTRRVLNILIFAAIAGIKSVPVIGIEEIETSIHPAKIGEFLDILTQLAPRSKFIVTSHSASVAQYINAQALYIGQPNQEGNARFLCLPNESSKLLTKEARQYGITIGEMIFNQLSNGATVEARLSSLLEVNYAKT